MAITTIAAPNIAPHPPQFDIYPGTLGATAIDMVDRAQEHEAYASDNLAGAVARTSLDFRDAYREEAQHAVADGRESIRSLDRVGRRLLESHVRSLMGSVPLHASGVEWLLNGPASRVFRFMERNAQRIAEQQSAPAFREAVESEKQLFLHRVDHGVRQGWLSAHATKLAQTVRDLPVYVGDLWGMQVVGHGLGRYSPSEGAVFVKESFAPTANEREQEVAGRAKTVLGHEFGHAAFDDYRLPLWLIEASKEHLEGSLILGRPDDLNPSASQRFNHVYHQGRALLYLLGVDPTLLTRAVSSGSIDTPEWAAMTNDLDRRWGVPRALQRVSHYVTEKMRDIQRNSSTDYDVFVLERMALSEVREDFLDNPDRVLNKPSQSPHAAKPARSTPINPRHRARVPVGA